MSNSELPLIGACQSLMVHIYALAERVAAEDTPVIITGETGVGKEVVADFIQCHSSRSTQPFVKVNCAALTETLFESELFGHEKGAFTGAVERHVGLIERAARGTLFLDEVSELPPRMQSKLLRVLQSGQIERVGGKEPVTVDFRLLCASNDNLEALVAAGNFRKDLFYRINVYPLQIPPLRDRRDEILVLAKCFLASLLPGRSVEVTPEAETMLLSYPWPGNVRELQNAMRRVAIGMKRDVLEVADLWWLHSNDDSRLLTPAAEDLASASGLRAVLESAEHREILAALERHNWNHTRAAAELNVSRSTLYAKLHRYGIKPPHTSSTSNVLTRAHAVALQPCDGRKSKIHGPAFLE